MFPRGWITVGAPAVSGEAALDAILAEEDAWAREANDRRDPPIARPRWTGRPTTDWPAKLVACLAGLGLLAVVLGYLKAGRGHQVPYTQTVDANVPGRVAPPS